MTLQFLKAHGFTQGTGDCNNLLGYYAKDSYFSFYVDKDGILKKVGLSTGIEIEAHGVNAVSNNPRMGSFSSGKSIALPCSVPEFESVFGKSDNIKHQWNYGF